MDEANVQAESGPPPSERRSRAPSAAGARVRTAAVTASLALATLVVLLIYATQPQSAGDFADRLTLLVDPDAYGPNLRSGASLQRRAARARAAGADSAARALGWAAVGAFATAAAAAPGPRDELAANDGLATALLVLGYDYLARGRGGAFGWGRDREDLRLAEDIAACAVALSPTQRRQELDEFVQQLEEELERPVAGRCPT